MAKKSLTLFFFLWAALLIIPLTGAVGISPPILHYDFQPNFKEEVSFTVSGAEKIGINLQGTLAEYMGLDKELVSSGESFTLSISLPAELQEFGDLVTYLTITEYASGDATVGASTAIRVPIHIDVPFPGTFANVRFQVEDVNLDENITFIINIDNKGTQPIIEAQATINIYDLEQHLLKSLKTPSYSILSQHAVTIKESLNSSILQTGSFAATAEVTYDHNIKIMNDTFRIGSLDVKIINHTKTFYNDTLSEFSLTVESNWNQQLKDVYAVVQLQDASETSLLEFRTVNANIPRFESQSLTGFLNPEGLAAGEYPLLITLHFNNQVKEFKSTITIIDRKDQGFFTFLFSGLSNNLLLSLIIILLVLGNIYLFYLQRKKKKGQQKIERKQDKEPVQETKKTPPKLETYND